MTLVFRHHERTTFIVAVASSGFATTLGKAAVAAVRP
jgi:hypothetical protein